MGAEKWLDIEIWNSPAECFSALKKRGYRIATTYLGTDSVFFFHTSTFWGFGILFTLVHRYLSVSLEIYYPLFCTNFRCHVSLNARSYVLFCEKLQLFCTNSENSMSSDL